MLPCTILAYTKAVTCPETEEINRSTCLLSHARKFVQPSVGESSRWQLSWLNFACCTQLRYLEGISSPVNPLQTSASQEKPAEIWERAFWSVPSVISWEVPVHLQEVWPSSVRTRPDARNHCRRAWLWHRLFFSDLVSSYSQNYLHDTHLQMLICNKNHRQNVLVKTFFFFLPKIFLIELERLGWEEYAGTLDMTVHHARWTLSSIHRLGVSPSSFRATGTTCRGVVVPIQERDIGTQVLISQRNCFVPWGEGSWVSWAMCQQTPERTIGKELASFWDAIPLQPESVGFCRSQTEGHWPQSEWTREVFTLRGCNIVEGERILLFFTVNETWKCCLYLPE